MGAEKRSRSGGGGAYVVGSQADEEEQTGGAYAAGGSEVSPVLEVATSRSPGAHLDEWPPSPTGDDQHAQSCGGAYVAGGDGLSERGDRDDNVGAEMPSVEELLLGAEEEASQAHSETH